VDARKQKGSKQEEGAASKQEEGPASKQEEGQDGGSLQARRGVGSSKQAHPYMYLGFPCNLRDVGGDHRSLR
jgi:hypothetical protein